MTCAARPVLTVAHTGRPCRTVKLEFTAPTACKIDHLTGVLWGGKDWRGQPMQMDRAIRFKDVLGGDDMRLRVDRVNGGQGEAVLIIAKT